MAMKNNVLALLESVLVALFFFFLLFLLVLVVPISAHEAVGQLEPVGTPEFRVTASDLLLHESRRRLAPFQLCLACKCCVSAADPTTCSTMPCCFGIDCQLPNKPFGVCAFVPKACSCTSCV